MNGRCAHTHATKNNAVPTKAASAPSSARSCDDAPKETTSNGDPPPETSFWAWAFCCGAAAADVAGGCASPVGAPPAIDVGFGSTSNPCDVVCAAFDDTARVEVNVEVVSDSEAPMLMLASEYAGGGTELVVVLAVVEVPAFVVLAVVAEDDAVTTSTPGQSDAMPMPNWKTPMMLVSPTSTFAHTLLITSPMSCSPCTHAELQRFGGVKSLAWQPLMVVVYAARH